MFHWLDNLSIRTRLLGAFGLVLAMLVAIIAISVRNGWQTAGELDAIVKLDFRKFELASDISAATKANARNTLELFEVDEPQRATVRQRMAATKKAIDGYFAELEPLLQLPEGKALFADMKAKRQDFVSAFTTASSTLDTQGKEVALPILKGQVLPALDALDAPIEKLKDLQKRIAQERGQLAQAHLTQQIYLSIGLGALAVAIGIVSTLLLMRSIMQPLATALTVTQEVGKGNLAVEFEVHGDNELSRMLEAMHAMKEHLSHVMTRIQESANSVAAASGQIASANIDLSARTEAQASSLEETAASMEEMTSTVQQNAQVTQTASQLAGQATDSAQRVGQLVGQVVHTMQDIHTSSQRIRDIVGVIDSIAFQTNILALNAAVEAARAGDQGKGFAVVASEVRSLAQRSASAAQEIKTIISDNVEKMDAGNQIAAQAGQAVTEAVQSIQKVNDTVSEVALATREQTQGIDQVGQAVVQLDEATQQNAALVEETAAATKHLDDQVQALKDQINRFQIGGLRGSSGQLVQRLN